MSRSISLFSILLLLPHLLGAQSDLRIGQWKSHMSHSTGNFVIQSTQHIYFGTNGGLLAINKTNEEVEFSTKVEGLSDISIQSMAWDGKKNRIVIGYKNSNLDLYDPLKKEVINLPDIQRNERILGDRFIYRIYIPPGSDFAYLACGFGVVELNVAKAEFGFTAFTGVPVYEVALYKNKLYASTESGVYAISYDKTKFNLSDFSQWQIVRTFDPIAFQAISVFNDKLYLGSGNKVYSWDGINAPTLVSEIQGQTVQYLSAGANLLLAGYSCKDCDGRLIAVDKDNKIISLNSSCVPRPLYGIIDEKDRGWFADRFQAFRSTNKITEPCSFKYFNTPLSPFSTDLVIQDGRIYVAAGGIDASYDYLTRGDGFFSYVDGAWRSYHRGNNADIARADLVDLFKMTIDPITQLLYIGTYWGGLMQCNMTDPAKPVIKIFDKSNSSLQGAVGDVARTRVGGLTHDRQGNLWMSNFLAERPITVMKKDGTWKSFAVPSSTQILACATDSVGYLWFSVIKQGLLAYDPGPSIDAITDDRYLLFSTANSVLENNLINAIATDQDGSVWVGTSVGVYVFECGESVFDNTVCKGAKRVLVQQDLGGGLLKSEDVLCIAIDGGNRKWFGTRNGILVVSAGGDQLVAQYTVDNSPLFDNLITVLRYEPKNGEMYIGTGSGVQSIRIDATEGSRFNKVSEIYAFPNPVRPEYTGSIAIQGMRNNSNIKITDFNGQLVNQGKSNGGTYIWNGLDLKERKVASGIYVVWISAGDGFEQPDTRTIKIAIVR